MTFFTRETIHKQQRLKTEHFYLLQGDGIRGVNLSLLCKININKVFIFIKIKINKIFVFEKQA
jgi:hypothetical protein